MNDSVAVIPLDVSRLNHHIVDKYLSYPKMIEALCRWTELADSSHLPELLNAAKLVRSIQPSKLPKVLFRGFNLGTIQDTMGLKERGFLFDRIKTHAAGEVFQYTLSRPLSCTTELRVATAFGKVVVKIDTASVGSNFLPLTPELSYAIGKSKFGVASTQHEVVLFPGGPPLNFTIIRSKSVHLPPSSSW